MIRRPTQGWQALRASSIATASHSLASICSGIDAALSTIFPCTLVALRNELTSLSIQCASVRLALTLDILLSSPTLATAASTPATRQSRATLALALCLLLLRLLLLRCLGAERILLLLLQLLVLRLHATTSTSSSRPSNGEAGLQCPQRVCTGHRVVTNASPGWGLVR